jgi:hypothetical protein
LARTGDEGREAESGNQDGKARARSRSYGRPSGIDAIATQQDKLARIGRSPALDALVKYQDAFRSAGRSPVLEAIAGQQAAIASLRNSPVADMISAQQAEWTKIGRSPAIDLIVRQQERWRLRWADSPMDVIPAVTQEITAAISTQLLSLRRPSVLDLQISRAVRSWSVAARPEVVERRTLAPKSMVALGSTTTSLVGAALELEDPESETEEDSDRAAWLRARDNNTESTLEWLASIDPRLANKYRGAWHAVGTQGPDWMSQCANSAVELIDWTLRRLAPEDTVREWQVSVGLYEDEYGGNGKPSRSLRIRYIGAANGLPATSVHLSIRATLETMKELQRLKHADQTSLVRAVTDSLVALDYCLMMLRARP